MSEINNEPHSYSKPSKSEIIASIAKTLVERRTARGLTLEKIHQSIKIRIPYLQAMEKGAWEDLPGDVYIKGFLRRYSQFLGLDTEKLLAPYFQFSQIPEKKKTEYPPVFKTSEFSRTHLVLLGLGSLLLIALVKLIKQEAPLAPVPLAESKALPPVTASTQTVGSVVTSQTPQKHHIEIYTPLSLWLRITTPSRNFEGFIPEASTWTWSAEGKFLVRLGHTKDLKMIFDGQPVVLEENQKKIELPREN